MTLRIVDMKLILAALCLSTGFMLLTGCDSMKENPSNNTPAVKGGTTQGSPVKSATTTPQ